MATLTLRPNGDSTPLELTAYPTGTHYTCVDEASLDTSDYVSAVSTSWIYDTFLFADPSSYYTGAITNVTVYTIALGTADATGFVGVYYSVTPARYGNSSVGSGSQQTYSYSADTCPYTSTDWTWTNITNILPTVGGIASSTKGSGWVFYQLYITVTYTESAPTVTTQPCTIVAATSCTGNGNVTATGGGPVTRRGFCYLQGTSGTPTTANTVSYTDGTFTTGAFTQSITGLTSGAQYRIRAYAVNSTGTSYGDTINLRIPNQIVYI